jgi:geranylgeranyl pyrophosphate synthase
MLTIGQAMSAEIQQCIHMENRINSSISSNCREQMERYRKKMEVCREISQKIANMCVTGQTVDLKCYEKHHVEREAACSGIK